ncbi:ankyrin [Tothia fuscella]|uniref:Ankyrin n=1 Tax=Tothia fuscella TaxID=1048955 RepID=A0A9P4NTT1_9PEZI|nr:ankyrin [Tothia fuscella]
MEHTIVNNGEIGADGEQIRFSDRDLHLLLETDFRKTRRLLKTLRTKIHDMSSLLEWASAHHEPTLRWLVQHGSDANLALRRRRGGWPHSIMSRAALHSAPSAMRFLLENGARPDNNALHMVIRRQSHKRRPRGNPRMTTFPTLTEHERIEMINLLIDYGADINAVEDNLYHQYLNAAYVPRGSTPLRMAVDFRDYEVIKLLVSRGADKNRRDDGGKTALEAAGQLNTRRKTAIKTALVGGSWNAYSCRTRGARGKTISHV